jgi:SP family general alpha glucoside:H+ symporter-like MFS transporter
MRRRDDIIPTSLLYTMAEKTVHATTDSNDPEVLRLIELAQRSDELDATLSVRQAISKYPKSVFWAMILSTALIMEGYDLVMVRYPSVRRC